MSQKKSKPQNDFDSYYHSIYKNRWETLKEALLQPDFKILYQNNAMQQGYLLDPASVRVAESLAVKSGYNVLDLCSAPGGKALVLLNNLEKGNLWVNDISATRSKRLFRVLNDFAKKEYFCIVT